MERKTRNNNIYVDSYNIIIIYENAIYILKWRTSDDSDTVYWIRDIIN